MLQTLLVEVNFQVVGGTAGGYEIGFSIGVEVSLVYPNVTYAWIDGQFLLVRTAEYSTHLCRSEPFLDAFP